MILSDRHTVVTCDTTGKVFATMLKINTTFSPCRWSVLVIGTDCEFLAHIKCAHLCHMTSHAILVIV